MDTRVLAAVAEVGTVSLATDIAQFAARIIRRSSREHVYLAIGGETFRLDLVCGTVTAGPVQISYLLARNGRLPKQIETIQRLEARLAGCATERTRDGVRIARLATALRAWDARMAGASLRDIAADLLEPGDWPGPGECRKSAARRLVATGGALVAAGPRPILAL